jgi:acetyltransferase-like isoleucine patch superfamily enzyme
MKKIIYGYAKGFFYFILNNIFIPKFKNKQNNLRIIPPFKIIGSRNIRIGNNVYIGSNSSIAAIERDIDGTTYNPEIIIGNNFSATSALQIHSTNRIEIEDDVLIASNVFLVDCTHGFNHIDIPYISQPLQDHRNVKIGRGCWVGQNVVILQGVTIGEMSIIGANSVVKDNIPAYCIAVGSPAKPIKTWDATTKSWIKIQRNNV